MNLSVKYMGLDLPNPVIVGSSSLTNSVKKIERLEKAGAGAVVLKSLFEEQILVDKGKLIRQEEMYFWYPEAIEFVNQSMKGAGIESYIQLISDTKKTVTIPVIASINCVTDREWPSSAKELELAGVDALELNIAIFPFNKEITAEAIEDQYVSIVKAVKKEIRIPVAVKIGPYFTNIQRITYKLQQAGADAIVLFNRFFSPNLNIHRMTITNENMFSSPEEMALTLRWVGLVSSEVKCDIGASTGIHTSGDVIRQLLMGAATTQICSTLYHNGSNYLKTIIDGLTKWMTEHGFNKINDFKGLISENKVNRPSFERLQFMKKSVGDILSPGGDIDV